MSYSGVKFKDQNELEELKSQIMLGKLARPKMVALIIKYSKGLIKTDRQAAKSILIFIVFAIAVSIFMFARIYFSDYTHAPHVPLPKEYTNFMKNNRVVH